MESLQEPPSLTCYDLPFPQNGGSICPQDKRMVISPQRVIRYTSCLVPVFFSSAVLILVLVLVTQVSHQNECDHTQVNHTGVNIATA